MDVYRAMQNGSNKEIRTELERFARSAEISNHPMVMEMMEKSDHETFRLVRHLPEILHHFLERSSREKAIPEKKGGSKAKAKEV